MGHILSAAYLSTQGADESACAAAHYRRLAAQVDAHMAPLSVERCGDSEQFKLRNKPGADNFEAEYVSFSGFFGLHNPAVFAAAPALLAALKIARRALEHRPARAEDMAQIDAAIEAAERQV